MNSKLRATRHAWRTQKRRLFRRLKTSRTLDVSAQFTPRLVPLLEQKCEGAHCLISQWNRFTCSIIETVPVYGIDGSRRISARK